MSKSKQNGHVPDTTNDAFVIIDKDSLGIVDPDLKARLADCSCSVDIQTRTDCGDVIPEFPDDAHDWVEMICETCWVKIQAVMERCGEWFSWACPECGTDYQIRIPYEEDSDNCQ